MRLAMDARLIALIKIHVARRRRRRWWPLTWARKFTRQLRRTSGRLGSLGNLREEPEVFSAMYFQRFARALSFFVVKFTLRDLRF